MASGYSNPLQSTTASMRRRKTTWMRSRVSHHHSVCHVGKRQVARCLSGVNYFFGGVLEFSRRVTVSLSEAVFGQGEQSSTESMGLWAEIDRSQSRGWREADDQRGVL